MRGPTIGPGGPATNGHGSESGESVLRQQSATGESMAPAGEDAHGARSEATDGAGEPSSVRRDVGATPFLTDVRTLRERARRDIESGALTRGYRGDAAAVVNVLNAALATEIVCTLRYRRHYFTARGPNAEGVKAEFLEHAQEEQEHADQIAERIVQLGGEPDFDPAGLTSRSHAEYVPGTSLEEMIREDLVAERIAIDSYREIVHWVAPFDPVTRALMEAILAKEEEHADELSDLLAGGRT